MPRLFPNDEPLRSGGSWREYSQQLMGRNPDVQLSAYHDEWLSNEALCIVNGSIERSALREITSSYDYMEIIRRADVMISARRLADEMHLRDVLHRTAGDSRAFSREFALKLLNRNISLESVKGMLTVDGFNEVIREIHELVNTRGILSSTQKEIGFGIINSMIYQDTPLREPVVCFNIQRLQARNTVNKRRKRTLPA